MTNENMGSLFLTLSQKHKTRVSNSILNASLIKQNPRKEISNTWRQVFAHQTNRHAGSIKQIYTELAELSDKDFTRLVMAMTE